MVEPRIAPLPFGFQEPAEGDFGRMAARLLAMAETEIGERQRRARWMVLPSVGFYLVFAFGFGVLLWSVGIELGPGAMAVATAAAFLAMAGLGMHYRNELNWADAAEGVTRLHRRFLVQGLVVDLLTGAFFTLPAMVLKNLGALFPNRPKVDGEVLAVATNLAAALDEPVPIRGPDTIMPHEISRAVVNEAVLLLVWAGIVTVIRQAGQTIISPGPRRHVLLTEITARNAYIVCLSALPRESALGA
jgi:hypothetical protein